MPKTTPTTSSAKRAKRPRRKSQAALPAKRPGPFDVIADRFDFDKVEGVPSRKFGFSLHLGGDGSRWSGQTGRMEMPAEKAIDAALHILGVVGEFGPPLNHAQRRRIAEFALGPVYSKRKSAITARYNARDITLEQAKHLDEEVHEQYLADCDALVAA
jgi:hypothetical protein